MKTPSIFVKAANAARHYHAKLERRRQAMKVADLPDYLLKDIGWPATYGENCVDCEQ